MDSPPSPNKQPAMSPSSANGSLHGTSVEREDEQLRWTDERGKEMDDAASVWPAYLHEALRYDAEDRARWTQSMDTLFIFAGLFSAVLTTFIVESYQQLQPDPQAAIVTALAETNALLLAMVAGQPAPTPAASIEFSPEYSDVLVNTLWFASLAISLSVSSLAVLVKGWINALAVDPSGSPRQVAHLRQSRHDGAEQWRLDHIIHSLPLLLLVALMLFLSGLAVFTWNLDRTIAGIVLAITSATALAYVASFVLPAVWLHCPFRAPFTEFAYHQVYRIVRLFRRSTSMQPTMEEAEAHYIRERAPDLDARSINWLVHNATDPVNRERGLHAVAGMGISRAAARVFRRSDIMSLLRTNLAACFHDKRLRHPVKADLAARGLINSHRSLRLFPGVQPDSSRVSDLQAISRLRGHASKEITVVGACAGGLLDEIFASLEGHIDGHLPLSSFAVHMAVDTIRHEFLQRKGYDEDHWVTGSSWGIWGRRACTILIQYLDRHLEEWTDPHHPDPLFISIVLTIFLFTNGPEPVLAIERSHNRDEDLRRRFIPVALRALCPIFKHAGRYLAQCDLALAARAFLRIAERISAVCAGQPAISQEVFAVLAHVDVSTIVSVAAESGHAGLVTGSVSVEYLGYLVADQGPLTISDLTSIAWQLRQCDDAWTRRALCLRLMTMARDPEEALKLFNSAAFSSLIVLAQQDISMPDRREAFRTLVLVAAAVVKNGQYRWPLLTTHRFLPFLATYFEQPWGLCDDDVRTCLGILRGIQKETRGAFRAQVAKAVQSIARWPERQWQGNELLYPYQRELDELHRMVGLQPVQVEPVVWRPTPRPKIMTARMN